MRRIKDDNPFTDDLYRRYLSFSSFLSMSGSGHGAIRIGYLNRDGISSVDPSTGKLTGVITDYVDLAEKLSARSDSGI